MRESQFTDILILAIFKQNEQGAAFPDLCPEHGMSSAQLYKWRAKFGGMDASMINRLKGLENENLRNDSKISGSSDAITVQRRT